MLPEIEQRRSHLCSFAIDTARLLPMSPLSLSFPKPHTSPHHPHSVKFLRCPLDGEQETMQNLKSHEVLAGHDSESADRHVCHARYGERESTQHSATTRMIPLGTASSFYPKGNSCSLLQNREQWWISDMDEYLAASQLCREEAMACSLQAAGLVHWPFAERENRKRLNNKSILLTCRALNAGTNKSWRGLKKLFSKQFMPFSNRDHRGLHHINTTISKRSLKALNVGGRRADARIQLAANKSECVTSRKKALGKKNVEQNGNAIREPSGIHAEICRSELGLGEKDHALRRQSKALKEGGGFKKKVYIVLRKASGVALEVCDILNLE